MKSVNELHKFVSLENGEIKNAYRDKGKTCLRKVVYDKDGELCLFYHTFDIDGAHAVQSRIVDTADTEEELERRKKEL